MFRNPKVTKLVIVCDATTYTPNAHLPGRAKYGPAACGVIYLNGSKDPDKILERCGTYLGEMTNNRAKYNAILFGLQNASKHCGWEIEVWSDSNLAINQLTGKWRLKDEKLGLVFNEIRIWEHRFTHPVSYNHHKRDDPIARLADAEAQKYQQLPKDG